MNIRRVNNVHWTSISTKVNQLICTLSRFIYVFCLHVMRSSINRRLVQCTMETQINNLTGNVTHNNRNSIVSSEAHVLSIISHNNAPLHWWLLKKSSLKQYYTNASVFHTFIRRCIHFPSINHSYPSEFKIATTQPTDQLVL